MFKRFLKIFGIVFAGFVVVVGAAFGITALRKGFDEVNIPITRIFFANESGNTLDTAREVYALEDFTTKLDFEPKDATNRNINVVVRDEVGVLDCDSKFTITAGKEFSLKLRKDANNNNYGGVATLEFRPEGGIAKATLRVVVDVEVPEDSLYFAGNITDRISTSGKNFTMAITGSEQYVYLRSNLVNAFFLDAGDSSGSGEQHNLKSVDVDVQYYEAVDQGTGIVMRQGESVHYSDLNVEHVFNNATGVYNYFYVVPVNPSVNGQIKLTAKMHRTYAIEDEYKKKGFDRLVGLLNNSTYETAEISYMLDEYNTFLNKHLSHFIKTDDGYSFFAGLDSNYNGVVNIRTTTAGSDNRLRQIASNVQRSQDFIFLSCSALVNITQVNLESLSTNNNTKVYKVFDSATYSLNGSATISGARDIVDDFGLSIGISNESVANASAEKKTLFNELSVKPYIYVDLETYNADAELGNKSVWAGYSNGKLPVYAFEDQKPIVENPQVNDAPVTYMYDREIGYLLYLKLDTAIAQTQQFKEFMTVEEHSLNGNKYWQMRFNVPVSSSSETLDITKTKSLYLQFTVTGMDNEYHEITKSAYTRVFINYTDYEFNDTDVSNLAFENVSPLMTINHRLILEDTNGQPFVAGMAPDLDTQTIQINTSSDKINNYDQVSYKSVLYFVESESNNVNGTDENAGKKIITSGKYSFVDMSGSTLAYGEGDLVGERIPTYIERTSGGIKTKDFYIQALNASSTPLKLFAVVYLSDVDGYPIDVNGRRLVFDENPENDIINQLVVFRISDLSDANIPQVTIQSYVDNMNFYTESLISKEFTPPSEDEPVIGAEDGFGAGYLKRNNITSWIRKDTGAPISAEYLGQITEYLKLKLLKGKSFTIYATNFELDDGGSPVDKSNDNYPIQLKDMYGNDLGYESNFILNTLNNKQIALNNLAADFTHYALQTNGGEAVSADTGVMETDGDGNAVRMIFTLTANDVAESNTIYLSPYGSAIPYSTAIIPVAGNNETETHWVTYVVNKLNINNCYINYAKEDSISSFYRINAQYKEGYSDGSLQFMTEESIDAGLSHNIYYFNKEGLSYRITNNLYDIEDGCTDLIDCSQQNNEDIYAYIMNLVATPNNTSTTYTNPSSVVGITQDLVFTSRNIDGTDYLIVGDNASNNENGDRGYPIDSDGTITVGDQVYELVLNDITNKYSYTFKAGSYFPVVNNKVVVMGKTFAINSDSNGKKYIKDSGDFPVQITETPKIVVKTLGEDSYTEKNYLATNYLTDRSSSVSSAISAVQNGEDTSYIVNFVKGEEIFNVIEDSENGKYYLDNGVYRRVTGSTPIGARYSIYQEYVKDDNGKYYFDETNNSYQPISVGIPTETKYSKRGVTVYLMINKQFVTTGNNGYEFSFTEVITYEVLQEEMSVFGNEKAPGGIVSTQLKDSSVNNDVYTVNVTAGDSTATRLTLGAQPDGNGYYLTALPSDNNFFNHVTFTASTDGIVKICDTSDGTFTNSCSGVNRELYIKAPSRLTDIDTTITVAYKVKTGDNSVTDVEVIFKVHVTHDVDFNEIPNSGLEKTDNLYKARINTGDNQSIDAILHTYFTFDNCIVTLSMVDSNNRYATISGDNLNVGKSYALYDGTSIVRDSFTCIITITANNGQEVPFDRRLEFTINPTYIIDTSALPVASSEPTYLFDGQTIYHNYIKLHEGTATIAQIRNNSALITADANGTLVAKYESVFKVNGVDTGKVLHNSEVPMSMTTRYNGSLQFKEGLSGNEVTLSIPYVVYVYGIEYTFTQGNDNTITLSNNTITNLEDYVNVSVSRKIYIGDNNVNEGDSYPFNNSLYIIKKATINHNGQNHDYYYIEMPEGFGANIGVIALMQNGSSYDIGGTVSSNELQLYYGVSTGNGYIVYGPLCKPTIEIVANP